MKVDRQIASFIGLKSAVGKPETTPQPIARPASTSCEALKGLARLPHRAERPAAGLRDAVARPRIGASALPRAASGTGSTAQRIEESRLLLKTQVAPAPAFQNSGSAEATRAAGHSPDASGLASASLAELVAASASTSGAAVTPATVAPPAAPSTSGAEPTAASGESENTHGLDGEVRESVAELRRQINECVSVMHHALNATPSQASADVLLQEATALRELAMLVADLMRQLKLRGGQAMVSLTAA